MPKLLHLTLAGLLLAPLAGLRADEAQKIQPDVVYGHKDGMALTYDVLRPEKANGAGVLWLQSGGWYSTWNDPAHLAGASKPYLDKGFTVFIVRHASAPRYAVPDAIEDVRRSVRAIRLKAKDYGVDPERLGVFGGSAGGHLSLILGTTGDDGDRNAKDPVLRQPSRVAAVVALYPPTDLRGWTTQPPAIIKSHPGLKPPLTFDSKKEEACSPLVQVSSRTAPILLIHGDKDELVPIAHSQNMMAALEKAKVKCKLIVIEGAAHGFNQQQNSQTVLPAMVGWFEEYLAERKTP